MQRGDLTPSLREGGHRGWDPSPESHPPHLLWTSHYGDPAQGEERGRIEEGGEEERRRGGKLGRGKGGRQRRNKGKQTEGRDLCAAPVSLYPQLESFP